MPLKDVGEHSWHPDFDSVLLAPLEVHRVSVIGAREPVPSHLWGSVLLLGNFDGLHLGHRALLAAARRHAALLKAPVGIMSCEPHPKQFFNPASAPFRLSGTEAKRFVCNRLDVDLLFMPRFDADFANLSPHDFAVGLLAGQLGVKAVVVGQDFHFGRARSGNVEDLKRFGALCDFDVVVVTDLLVDGERISSTRVRSWIAAGELEKVNAALEGSWITKVTINADRLLEFEESAILPPTGEYLAKIWGDNGYMIDVARIELRADRVARFISEGVPPGAYLISDWKFAD